MTPETLIDNLIRHPNRERVAKALCDAILARLMDADPKTQFILRNLDAYFPSSRGGAFETYAELNQFVHSNYSKAARNMPVTAYRAGVSPATGYNILKQPRLPDLAEVRFRLEDR